MDSCFGPDEQGCEYLYGGLYLYVGRDDLGRDGGERWIGIVRTNKSHAVTVWANSPRLVRLRALAALSGGQPLLRSVDVADN